MSYPLSGLPETVYTVDVKTLENFILSNKDPLADGFFIVCTVQDHTDRFFYEPDYNDWTFYASSTPGVHTSVTFRAPREQFLAENRFYTYHNISRMLDQAGISIVGRPMLIWKIQEGLLAIANDSANAAPKVMPVLVEITAWHSEDITDYIRYVTFIEQVLFDETEENNAPRARPAARYAVEQLEKLKLDDAVTDQQGCTVCLEDFSEGAEVIFMPCEHLFHGECIIKWLQNSNLCPLCRFQMPVDE